MSTTIKIKDPFAVKVLQIELKRKGIKFEPSFTNGIRTDTSNLKEVKEIIKNMKLPRKTEFEIDYY